MLPMARKGRRIAHLPAVPYDGDPGRSQLERILALGNPSLTLDVFDRRTSMLRRHGAAAGTTTVAFAFTCATPLIE